VITMEEVRLTEALKRAVPEPPVELSAERVIARYAGRFRWSRLTPAFAAAAVAVAAGSGIGIAATHHSSTSSSAARETTRTIQVTLTDTSGKASATGKASTTAPRSFVMPNVVGMTSAQAIAALNAAGAAGNIEMTLQGLSGPFNAPVPPGTVYKQYPAPGTLVRYTGLSSALPVPKARAIAKTAAQAEEAAQADGAGTTLTLVPSLTPTPAPFQPGWMPTPQVILYVQPSGS
jgi:hypothetical protein